MMSGAFLRKFLMAVGAVFFLWLAFRFVLPVSLPFLFGAALALAAEPVVALGIKKCRLPRAAAAAAGVSITLVLLVAVLSFVGALAVRELGSLTRVMPDLEGSVRQGMTLLQQWLTEMTDRAPEGIRPLLHKTVQQTFDGGTTVIEQVTQRIPGVVGAVLGRVPDGALRIGTGILASYMISARLPKLRQALACRLPKRWYSEYLPALRRMRKGLGGWLKAQGKLALVTYGIVTVGFLLLRISYGPVWAVLIALVDAIPVLGTGTVLVPWALVCLLQRQHFRAIGLLCVYGAAAMTRSALEPRMVGRQLGIDPLVTLIALYTGYRFFGIVGMVLAPVAVTAIKSLTEKEG